MSPEQISGDDLSGHSDLFSLGVLLTELLLSRRPLDSGPDGSPQQTMERIRSAAPEELRFLSGLSIELCGLLRRCLSRRPQDRQGSAAELGQALGRARRAFPAVGPPDLAAWVTRCRGAPSGDRAAAPSCPPSPPWTPPPMKSSRRTDVRRSAALPGANGPRGRPQGMGVLG